MKSTQVDSDGRVRCPVCGADDFSDKRTGKAKAAGFITLGIGVVAMPKRLKCRGCGTNLKRGGGPYKPAPKPAPKKPAIASTGPRDASLSDMSPDAVAARKQAMWEKMYGPQK